MLGCEGCVDWEGRRHALECTPRGLLLLLAPGDGDVHACVFDPWLSSAVVGVVGAAWGALPWRILANKADMLPTNATSKVGVKYVVMGVSTVKVWA